MTVKRINRICSIPYRYRKHKKHAPFLPNSGTRSKVKRFGDYVESSKSKPEKLRIFQIAYVSCAIRRSFYEHEISYLIDFPACTRRVRCVKRKISFSRSYTIPFVTVWRYSRHLFRPTKKAQTPNFKVPKPFDGSIFFFLIRLNLGYFLRKYTSLFYRTLSTSFSIHFIRVINPLFG